MAISRKKRPTCPIEVTINAVAARWKAMILWRLRAGARSFGEIKADLPRISDRMLSTQLAQLAEDGVAERTGRGAAVRWALTPLGRDLLPVLDAMQRWGDASLARHRTPAPREAVAAGLDASAAPA